MTDTKYGKGIGNKRKKLSSDGQYQIRLGIIRLWKKEKTNSKIAEIFNVSERHVRSVKKKYLNGGLILILIKYIDKQS